MNEHRFLLLCSTYGGMNIETINILHDANPRHFQLKLRFALVVLGRMKAETYEILNKANPRHSKLSLNYDFNPSLAQPVSQNDHWLNFFTPVCLCPTNIQIFKNRNLKIIE